MTVIFSTRNLIGNIIHNPWRFCRQIWRRTALYRFTLMGRAPKHLSITPADPWPGEADSGRLALAEAKLTIAGHFIALTDLWMPKQEDITTLTTLHQFAWLRDLRATGDNSARRLSRQLIANWISRNQDWRLSPWQVGITGHRIANWLALYDFFCSSADEKFREMFFRETARQVRHLAFTWQEAPTPLERFYGLKGLIYAAAAFPSESSRLAPLLAHAEQQLGLQILADGGHVSRNPRTHLLVLRDLIDIRAMLRLVHYPVPAFLQKYIRLMVPVIRLLRHGDGGLAAFGNDLPVPPTIIDMILSLADIRGRPPEKAAALGIERAANTNSLVLLNVGPKMEGLCPSAEEEETGTLNFEWSVGQDRVVLQGDVVLQAASGQPCKISPAFQPDAIQAYRKSQDGHTLVDMAYERADGLPYRHRRQLYLSARQAGLQGEDTFCVNEDACYGIRFFIDRKYETSVASGGRSGLIRLPAKEKTGFQESRSWQLLASGAEEIVHEPHASFPGFLLLGRLKANQPLTIQWAFRPH